MKISTVLTKVTENDLVDGMLVIPSGITHIISMPEIRRNIEGIFIPNTVEVIAGDAFKDCENLKQVKFQSNSQLTEIGKSAFENCSSLKSITIPSSVEKMGDYCFMGCRLEEVSFQENSNLRQMGMACFAECSHLKEINLPDVNKISAECFAECESLESFNIPSSVEQINVGGFFKCHQLRCVNFDENSELSVIKRDAFKYCGSLSKMDIPSSIKKIEKDAFYGTELEDEMCDCSFDKNFKL